MYARIHIEYVVRGDVEEEKLRRAIELSRTTYCSASNNLERGGTAVTTSY